MTDPRIPAILSRYNLTLSQRMGLERDIGEMMKPSESIAALVEAYGKAESAASRELGDAARRGIAILPTKMIAALDAKSALLAAIAAVPSVATGEPSKRWEDRGDSLVLLDVQGGLLAVVKRPDAEEPIPADRHGHWLVVYDEWSYHYFDDGNIKAAQLAAESVLRAIARGIDAAIAAVPGEIVAAAREVMRLDGAMTPGPWTSHVMPDADQSHRWIEIEPTHFATDHTPFDDEHMRARSDGAGIAHARTAAPLLAAWVIAQAEGRGE